uniref:Uncharacterized protein n=1 Tax=Panagrolaimus sp. ES5 TaxID=591445 RepID=A0AC34GG81_9BILA
MAILMILAIALCILLFQRIPKTTTLINTTNLYHSAPMLKENEFAKITGTSL